MEQAIQLLQQQLETLVYGLRDNTSKYTVQSLIEIQKLAASLAELHTIRADMEAAKAALVNAERTMGNISNMGTVAGSPGHAIVSAVMANRVHVRRDVREREHEGVASSKMLSELVAILDSTPIAAPVVKGSENLEPAPAAPEKKSRPDILAAALEECLANPPRIAGDQLERATH